jgi:hypothetical protein
VRLGRRHSRSKLDTLWLLRLRLPPLGVRLLGKFAQARALRHGQAPHVLSRLMLEQVFEKLDETLLDSF